MTTPPPAEKATNAHRCLVIAFLAIIALVPLGQAVFEAVHGRWPVVFTVFTQVPTAKHLAEYERTLEDASVVQAAVRPRMQALLYHVLGDLGAQVLAGRDGWLFYQPGVVASSERAHGNHSSAAQALAAVRDLRDQLASRGIHLLVMPVPNKESVHPEPLTGRRGDDRPVSADTRAFLAGCAEDGIAVVNLFARFAEQRHGHVEPLYLRQDTHWLPATAELAAHAVATRLRNLGWITQGTTRYERKPFTGERHGDLVTMVQAPGIVARLAPERITATIIIDSLSGEPYRDARSAEVVVLGDSFLRIYERDEPGSAGFVAHLAAELGQPLVSIVNDGGASTLVRQALARRAHLLDHAQVVVWAFVERDLRLGMEGWQLVPLRPRPSADP